MKVSYPKSFITGFLLLFAFTDISTAQPPSVVQVCVSYPREKESKSLYVFFAKKNMGKIEYGQRMIYNFYNAGDLKVTIQEDNHYTEPRTLSHTSRTVSLKSGSSYYFEINGKAELVYFPDPAKGKEFFEKKNYSSAPLRYEIAAVDSLVTR